MEVVFYPTESEWLGTIYTQSKNSAERARYSLKCWNDFLQAKNITPGEILERLRTLQDRPECYLFLNNFVLYMQGLGLGPVTVKINFYFVKKWLRANGIRINNEDTKQFISFPKKLKELRRPLTLEMVQKLVNNAAPRLRALLLVLVSSGMRVSEAVNLRVANIDAGSHPVKIRIPAEITKTREERLAFISREAWEALQPLLSGLHPQDYIFQKKASPKCVIMVEHRFANLRAKCGFDLKYANGRNYHVNIHALRAFFHTQATHVLGGDIAHAMIGHHRYLDQYFRMTDEERARKYLLLEPHVTINNEVRLRNELEEKNRQLYKQNVLEARLQQLAEEVAKLQRQKLA
jgi:integrase